MRRHRFLEGSTTLPVCWKGLGNSSQRKPIEDDFTLKRYSLEKPQHIVCSCRKKQYNSDVAFQGRRWHEETAENRSNMKRQYRATEISKTKTHSHEIVNWPRRKHKKVTTRTWESKRHKEGKKKQQQVNDGLHGGDEFAWFLHARIRVERRHCSKKALGGPQRTPSREPTEVSSEKRLNSNNRTLT